MLQKEGPRRPQTGSKAQKHVKMEALKRILCCFVSNSLCRHFGDDFGLGGKPKVGASWVPPGCQGLLRWLKIYCLGSHAGVIDSVFSAAPIEKSDMGLILVYSACVYV